MFRKKTVFIVGAGASYEVGLPLGGELSLAIADRLRYRIRPDEPFDGDQAILQAVHRHASKLGKPGDDYVSAARCIADAMALSPSIDNYIDAHRGTPEIEICGKLAILRCILEAEAASRLKAPDGWPVGMGVAAAQLNNTWFNAFFKRLVEGVRKVDVDTLFANVAFIIFNYDRCVEHFLFHALQIYYSLPEDAAVGEMERLKICHPYGVVGKLPWQDSTSGVLYRATDPRLPWMDLVPNIRTFTEGITDTETTDSIHHMLELAEHVVFLGFAYHEMNLDILGPTGGSVGKSVIGTAIAISDQNLTAIQPQVVACFGGRMNFMQLNSGLTCYHLLETYSKFLTS